MSKLSEKQLRELDVWIAEHVMGFKSTKTPDDAFDSNERLSFSGSASRRFMVSTTYQYNGKGKWWHQWHYYEPTTDPAAALEVLKKCYQTLSICSCKTPNGFKFWFPSEYNSAIESEALELAICLFAKKLFSK